LCLLTFAFAISRYKLRVKAEDGEAVINMVFFGDVATNLIGKPLVSSSMSFW
jgi:hypothetical protein